MTPPAPGFVAKWKWTLVLVVAAVVTVVLAYGRGGQEHQDEMPYLYEDTKQLVGFVEDAAGLIEARGADAFNEFGAPGSRWSNAAQYVFVYTLDGTCVFHPVTPELVGRKLIDLRDMNGRLMIERITAIGRHPEPKASGWEFYLWQDRTEVTPTWKSSYIRKAVTPDHQVFVVGSGLHNLKVEPTFIRSEVDRAAEFLQKAGKAKAFEVLLDPQSDYHFFDTYVFVLDETGKCLVDPAFPILTTRDMTQFRDAVGRKAVAEAVKRLQKSDSAWAQYLLPKPGASMPSRKMMYLRKVKVDGETLIVGATAFMATPIWMKL